MVSMQQSVKWLAATVLAGAFVAAPALAAPYATDWIPGHNSKTRLIVGGAPGENGAANRYVALEIALNPGWKTYWRQPGSAGGIPPQVSWQGSENLNGAKLKFPAPTRMADPTGETIGYKTSVVFPVLLAVNDPSKPVKLNLRAFFGVCREICIPAQADFNVTVPPALFRRTPPELARSLDELPRTKAAGDDVTGPRLNAVKPVKDAAGNQLLIFDVAFPGGTSGADLFVETGDLAPLAMTKKVAAPGSGQLRFQLKIDDSKQWEALGRDGVMLTMVSAAGASQVKIPRPQ